MAMGPGPGYGDPSMLGSNDDPSAYNGGDAGGEQASPQQDQPKTDKQRNPSVSYYKPRGNFNPQDSKTIGSAMQIDLSTRKELACAFVNTAAQCAKMGSDKVFDWKNKLSLKLSRIDISTLLTTLEFWTPEVSLVHKHQGKTTIFSARQLGKISEDWAKNLLSRDKDPMSPFCFVVRLSQSVDGQQGSVRANSMILQPGEAIELKEFLKWCLWKLFAVT